MARRTERPILVPLLLLNSALLAVLLLVCQTNKLSARKTTVSRPPAVAGSRVIRLSEQTAAISGNGKVAATGALRIEGIGRFAAVASSELLLVNGVLYLPGQIAQSDELSNFVIEGPDLFAEVSGQGLTLAVSGSGQLSPDIEITTEIFD